MIEDKIYDVAVVGAGPAGSLCAYLLAKNGFSTLLLDRSTFPRSKVCGSCIAPSGLHILEACGLTSAIVAPGAPVLSSMRISCGNRSVTISLPLGRAVSRSYFDSALFTAARTAGVHALSATRFVRLINHSRNHLEFEVRSLQHQRFVSSIALRSKILIDASGLSAVVMRGFTSNSLPSESSDLIGLGVCLDSSSLSKGVVEMQLHDHGYIGAVTLEDGGLDIAAACQRDSYNHFGSKINEIANHYAEAQEYTLCGTPALCHAAPLSVGRCVALGDCARYHEPFTGQGISWALSSAYQFAQLAINLGLDQALHAWPHRYQSTIIPQMRTCRVFASLRRARMLGPRFISLLRAFPTISNLLSNYAWQKIELHS